MGILNLPNELILLIAEDLSVKDLSHFLSTSRRLSSLLTPHLYKLALQDVGRCPALLWAVIHGHASLAELVISKGAEVDKISSSGDGQTPLHVAAELDYPDVIHLLVKHGARIDATNFARETPLHRAAGSGSPLAVRALLELGADVACVNKWGDSPARVAACLGLIDCLRPFLDAGLDLSHKDAYGRTILHVVILEGVEDLFEGFDMVDYLLDNGGVEIINAQDNEGATPLHMAGDLLWGSEKLVRLLLRYGADVEVKDNQGRTPCLY